MSRKLNDGFPEKTRLSYADLHHEITKTEADNYLKSLGNQQKQATCKRATEEDELIRYMSSLPGYLERGEKIPDKALNVGVLDWTSLEQWRYSHKYVPYRSSQSSASASNSSSSVSTEELSAHSSRGISRSPPRQRLYRPPLQSHFMATPMQDHSIAVKSSGGSVGNCQTLRGGHSNMDTHRKYVRVGDHLSQNHPASILKACVRTHLNPHINKESDILPNDRIYEVASCAKVQMSTQDVGMEKKVEDLREQNIDTNGQDMPGKSKPIVLILPRDIPQNSHCGAPDMPTSMGQKLGSPSQTRFSVKPKESSFRYQSCDISYSCPLPVPDELSRSHSQTKGSGSSSIDPESFKISASSLSAPIPVRMGISPCRSRKAEERKHTIAVSSSANGPPKGLDQKVRTEKSRSSSPFRRFSLGIGFASKGSGCREVEHVPQQSSTVAPKSCSENARGYASSNITGNDKPGDAGKNRSSPLRRFLDPLVKPKMANCRHPAELSQKVSENQRGYAISNISGNNKSADAGRSRSSPLRRLLDPLLKPKAANSRHSIDLSQKDSVLSNKNCRMGNGKFSTLPPENELGGDQRVGCSTVNTADSLKDKRHVPSRSQALLRIAVKNGQPLFTFAVDNNSNILAATAKNLTASRQDKSNCIYTFFTFREVKKKNGSWMNQAGRSKGPDYTHHVVAQMKVSDSHCDDSTSQNRVDSSISKEFVLFSVKLKQGDAQVTDYQPNDELAAIVVKSPKAISSVNGAHHSSYQNDSQDLLHVTVVLPSGVHSLPSNGGPSSLIERWKTGGSCDCGGWDLACKLKILANENQTSRRSRTSKAYFADQFELFFQGNDQDQENWPVFNFSPFKPGVYSVAFDSSLSFLQAFSICIALVDGKIPYELSGSRNSIEGRNPRETLLVQTDELKAFGKFEDIPASYVAYPPLSPVGRV